MLSRTADHLFWMARYTERAENTARMLDVNIQTQLLPQSVEAAEQSWRALLGISELLPAFDAALSIVLSTAAPAPEVETEPDADVAVVVSPLTGV